MRPTGTPSSGQPSRHSIRGLDWLNFFLADVQSGVGPFLAIYLVSAGWNEEQVGMALTTSGVAGILAQTPVGALIDRSRSKRALIAAGTVALACAGLIIALYPAFWAVLASEAAVGVSASVFVPAVCAISLGLVGSRAFDRRQGRNQAFNSAGNVFAALSMGAIAYAMSNRSIFFFVAVLAVPALLALRSIRPDEIDYLRARGAKSGQSGDSAAIAEKADRPVATSLRRGHALTVFLICSVLFHFANAAMLSLLGEMLAKGQGRSSMMTMSACVIVTQLLITCGAATVGRTAGQWGRKPLMLVAFAVLPLRGLLYTQLSSPAGLISVQVLDGVAAGIFGVISVLIIADLTRGSGRFNLTLGAYSTAIGIGASLSQLVGGSIAHREGFRAGFLFLAGIAALAFACFAFLMPETLQDDEAPAAQRPGSGG